VPSLLSCFTPCKEDCKDRPHFSSPKPLPPSSLFLSSLSADRVSLFPESRARPRTNPDFPGPLVLGARARRRSPVAYPHFGRTHREGFPPTGKLSRSIPCVPSFRTASFRSSLPPPPPKDVEQFSPFSLLGNACSLPSHKRNHIVMHLLSGTYALPSSSGPPPSFDPYAGVNSP